ncbi:MAG: HAMP domain-containing sensor histidine kinase [Clostridium sp.]|nr:HAMP domain-containing sensor histidine kinase [Clostridium sp.]
MLEFAVVIMVLSILVVSLIAYIIFLQLQIQNINHQLVKRLREHTNQPINLSLINSKLNTLAANINKCLKAEEVLRIKAIREEKNFKEMISNVSHDLRTPLTAIKGYQQLIEKDRLSSKQEEKLKIAQKHTDELGSLIEHFFEYTYLLNSEPKLNIERINLTNLSAECIAEAVTIFEENNLKVNFCEAPPVFVMADKEVVIRIIQNLIRNCIEHAEGSIDVQVSSSKNAVLSFKNSVKNSCDIDIKRIFDRFYTADKSRNKTTGLGLSIVKLLAEQLNGRVSASLKNNIINIKVEFPNKCS